ncbi:MAG TPA: glycosyltransferase, partial [Candidatus Norongarragalinales archaeon]|nr:glycosyltransferase [Candidatus Norongarragalinales archaeon]
MNRLKDYAQFVGDDYVESLYDSASRLDGKSMVHVNSTYYGGGVAEMLNSYVPLLNDAGLATEWRLLKGSKEFFSVTKKIHNSLQGKGIPLSKADVECYEETIASNAEFTNLDWYDLVVVDDPQPCGLIKHFSRESPSFFKPLPAFLKLLEFQKKQPWVWRCHIDLSSPNRKTWGYLKEMLRDYDAIVVSARRYKTQLNKPHHYITPAIDPLSDKNRKLSDAQVERELKKNGIDGGDGVPLIVQVSRFDPWKDPLGVLEAFRRVRKKTRCKLVLIGSMASDDPEGDKVFQKVYEQARKNDDVTLITV